MGFLGFVASLLRKGLVPFGAFLALAGGGCALLERLGISSPALVFSHKVHCEMEEMKCEECHTSAAKEGPAEMPKRKQCIACHEGSDEAKPAGETIADRIPDPVQWHKVVTLPKDIIFSRKAHGEAGVDCESCHPGIRESTEVTDRLRVSMEHCRTCHAKQAGKDITDCAVCHPVIRKDIPPPDHQADWTRRHGPAMRQADSKTEARCNLCHTEASCDACHRQEMPKSHTSLWRGPGHGIAAKIDRSSCATCHTPDACDRCHQEAAPRTHVGSWADGQSTHCLYCHGTARDSGCATCHKETPHLSASAKPAGHAAGMNCRSCHSPVPHADNGANCNSCHR